MLLNVFSLFVGLGAQLLLKLFIACVNACMNAMGLNSILQGGPAYNKRCVNTTVGSDLIDSNAELPDIPDLPSSMPQNQTYCKARCRDGPLRWHDARSSKKGRCSNRGGVTKLCHLGYDLTTDATDATDWHVPQRIAEEIPVGLPLLVYVFQHLLKQLLWP